jgi:hypothetical protein
VPDPEPESKPAVPYEPPPGGDATGDVVFEALWEKVLSAWDDDKVHASLLEYAITAERLPDAAGRYRSLKDDPEKGERAKKRLDAIVIAATQMLMSMKTPGSAKVPASITLSAFGIFVFMTLFVAYAVFHRQ